jgi:hypothetical protein
MTTELASTTPSRSTVSAPDRWLVAVVLTMLFLPALAGLTGRSARERARSGEVEMVRPRLARSAGVGSWLKQMQEYLRATFGFRPDLIRWNALLKERLGLSERYGPVTHGQDGWLYYNVHRGTHGLRPELPFGTAQLDTLAGGIVSQQRLLAARGIPFLLVLVPDKETVYPDLLPVDLPPARDVSRLDALVARLRSEGVAIVDLRPVLRGERAASSPFHAWPLYHRTDTHWNELGAFLGARAVLSELRSRFGAVHVPKDAELDVFTEKAAGGDLARMEGLQDMVRETMVRARVRSGCRFDPLEGRAPSNVESRVIDAQRLECPGAPIGRALVLHDSMMFWMTQFLAPAFRHSVWRYTETLDPALLDPEPPDLVIREMIERLVWEHGTRP